MITRWRQSAGTPFFFATGHVYPEDLFLRKSKLFPTASLDINRPKGSNSFARLRNLSTALPNKF